MTNQEKYEVIEEVCSRIREAMQREADRLKDCADKAENKMSSIITRHEATVMVSAQICVSAAETMMEWELIQKMTKGEP